jgi:alpha-1,6-mannosyltransferase
MGLAAARTVRIGQRRVALPSRARTVIAYGSLAALLVSGVAIALLAANPRSPLVHRGRLGLPGWLVGPLGNVSPARATRDGFYLLVAVMCAGYVGVLAARERLRARYALVTIGLLHVAFVLAPPLLSSDVFNYIDYARLGVLHGLDPYVHGPSAARHDPVWHLTAWRHVASTYGPLFTLASYPLAHVSVAAALWWLKAVTGLASLGCAALVWRIARQLGRSPLAAVAMFGLNPLLLVWTVGGAHNDVLMLLLMLAGVSVAIGAREGLGAAMLVAAAAVKASAALAVPFLLLASRSRRALAGVLAASAAVYAAAALAFPGHPLGVLSVLATQHQLVGFNSVPDEVALLFGFPGVTPGLRTLTNLVLVAALAWIALRVWRGADWVAACGWALVVVIVTATWFLPWYAVWPLAFAAVTREPRLTAATLGLQAFWLLNHVPHFTV